MSAGTRSISIAAVQGISTRGDTRASPSPRMTTSLRSVATWKPTRYVPNWSSAPINGGRVDSGGASTAGTTCH